MQITIDTPPLDSITDYRAALVALDAQLQPAWQYRARLAQLASAPARIDEVVAGVLEATGRERGAAWQQPQGAHDAYPAGWAVTHGGTEYISTQTGNASEPGTTGAAWVIRVEPGDGPVEWAVGLEVAVDMEVIFDGQLWRAKLAHTAHEGWVPSPAAQAVWELLGPA